MVILYPRKGWALLERGIRSFTEDFMADRNQPAEADKRSGPVIRHLVNTSICIEMIRGRSCEVVLKHLHQHPPGSLGISSITLAELQYGRGQEQDPGRNAAALAHVVAQLVVLPFNDVAAPAYGRLRRPGGSGHGASAPWTC